MTSLNRTPTFAFDPLLFRITIFIRIIILDAASVEKVPSPTFADTFAHPISPGFPLGSDVSSLAAGGRPWLRIGDVRPCARVPRLLQGMWGTCQRGHVSLSRPLATLPRHAPVTARTLRWDRWHRAPRHRRCSYHKLYAEQVLIRQSRECNWDPGIWNVHFKASPARPPLSGEQLAGGGTPPPLVR